MRPGLRFAACACLLLLMTPGVAVAQGTYFVGVIGGVATLSGDATSSVTRDGFESSSYKPENGAAVNLFLGAHLREYATVQANYIWNQNTLLLFSGAAERTGGRFFEQPRASSQHAVVGDLLVYFRRRASRIRPYLSGGLGLLRVETTGRGTAVDGGLAVPPPQTSATEAILRVAVGIDITAGTAWRLRYSFSESIGRNPLSRDLDPPGTRGLMNFQNLIGVVFDF